MKLALISFDGLDPRVIYRQRDALPAFDDLMQETMHGAWRTPGHTIPSYIHTLTGRRYNTTNFRWDLDEGGFARHRQTEFDFIWDQTDATMSLINLPVLYPPEDIDDCMVCGFLAPDDLHETNLARPDEIQDFVNEMEYTPDVAADETYDALGPGGMIQKLTDMMDDRVNLAHHVIDTYDSDLFYGVWTAPDRWFHQCKKHGDDYMPLYRHASIVLEELFYTIPDDVPLVVFSDHGFAHNDADNGIHKGHMEKGWYSVRAPEIPPHRSDASHLYDLYPTVMNVLEGEIPEHARGKALIHTEEQDGQVESRLDDLGYL